jgi:hypothetical protein
MYMHPSHLPHGKCLGLALIRHSEAKQVPDDHQTLFSEYIQLSQYNENLRDFIKSYCKYSYSWMIKNLLLSHCYLVFYSEFKHKLCGLHSTVKGYYNLVSITCILSTI